MACEHRHEAGCPRKSSRRSLDAQAVMVNRIMGSSYTAEDFGFPVSQQPEAQVHNGALPAIKRTKETIMATSPKKGPNSACAVAPEHPRPACRHAAAASRSCLCADTLLWWRVQCTIRLQGPSNSKKRPTCSRQPLSLQQAVFAEMSSSAKAITHVTTTARRGQCFAPRSSTPGQRAQLDRCIEGRVREPCLRTHR